MSHRSQSAAPSDSYRGDRRGSLSPPDDRYMSSSKDYPVLPLQQQQSFTPKFQSRSATATPTGSPKKRQLPKVPQVSRNAAIRDRLMQDFEDRSTVGRRHRGARQHHMPQYRSTGQGGALSKSHRRPTSRLLMLFVLNFRLGTSLFWTVRQRFNKR